MNDPSSSTTGRPDPTQRLREQLWETIVEVRDAAPRVHNDADSHDIVEAILPIVAQVWEDGVIWALRDQGNTVDAFVRDAVRDANPHRSSSEEATVGSVQHG